MAIILAIDPGSRVTGYGVIETRGANLRYIDSGCIKTITDPLAQRLQEIYTGIQQIIATFEPDEFAIEQIFMSRSADSALKLGHARGVAMLAGANGGLDVHEYAARKVKQAVVGTGAATKEQVQHMVQTLLKIPGKPQADAADALATGICHINTQLNLSRLAGARQFRRGRLVNEIK